MVQHHSALDLLRFKIDFFIFFYFFLFGNLYFRNSPLPIINYIISHIIHCMKIKLKSYAAMLTPELIIFSFVGCLSGCLSVW